MQLPLQSGLDIVDQTYHHRAILTSTKTGLSMGLIFFVEGSIFLQHHKSLAKQSTSYYMYATSIIVTCIYDLITCIQNLIEDPLCGSQHQQSSDTAVVMQLKQDVGEQSQSRRRDKRQVAKLQLELLQAKQLVDKLHGNKQVPHMLVMIA